MKMVRLMFCGFFVIMIWGNFLPVCAQEQALPVIELEQSVYDFGRVTQGQVIKHDFHIFNRGTAPLEIKEVEPD